MITDNELIGKHLFKNDGQAFEELVHRHSALVMGVCRGMLCQSQDAEDAFQATFLILSRKSKSLLNHGSIAGWLYQTAVRNCLQIRRRKFRHKETEMVEDPVQSDEPWETISQAQEKDLVYQEINRLPKRYRDVIVLCHLDGCTRAQAAELLDWSESAVKASLARARNLLRKRLVRSGVFTAAMLTMLKASTAHAKDTVSESLVSATLTHCQGLTPTAGVGTSAQLVQSIANQGIMTMQTSLIFKSLSAAALLFAIAIPIVVYAQNGNGDLPNAQPIEISDSETSGSPGGDVKGTETVQFVKKGYAKKKPAGPEQVSISNQSSDSQSLKPIDQDPFSVNSSSEYWQLLKQSYQRRAEAAQLAARTPGTSSQQKLLSQSDEFEYRAKAIEAELNMKRIASAKAKAAEKSKTGTTSASRPIEIPAPNISQRPTETSPRIVPRSPVQGVVLNVKGETLALNLGIDDGIKEGNTIEIFRDNIYIARARIIEVDAKFSAAEIVPQFKQYDALQGDRFNLVFNHLMRNNKAGLNADKKLEIDNYQEQLSKQMVTLAQLKSVYEENHPAIRQAKNNIKAITKAIQERAMELGDDPHLNERKPKTIPND